VLDWLRFRLASVEAMPLLALLGICSGVFAGSINVLFRLTVEFAQGSFLPGGQPENYEGLSLEARLLTASLGGLVIGLVWQFITSETRRVGVVHVMERLAYYQGYLPFKNALMQFIGAALSVISGQSVGREGPGVHLGAASGSLIGQWLELPNNSTRTLVACGIAAAIAASFNTPIAGVIFAMEVVLMEYTIAGFAPVILAAVTATILTRGVFGPEPAFSVPSLQLGSLLELPYFVAMGFIIGVLAFLFIYLLERFNEWGNRIAVWQRLTIAGVATGVCGLLVPEIMGIGYDTVNQALLGELGLGLLGGILLMKLFATTMGLGLGLPGGLIGPTLVIGAAAGGFFGLIASLIFPGHVSSHGFFAMLGMGAMMGATLQAPLAALMAMLELTANPNIILPGMLAVIVAGMTSRHLFKKESVFLVLLKSQGMDYRNDPVTQSLRRVGVASVMDRSFVTAERLQSLDSAKELVREKPIWILIHEKGQPKSLLLAADLARHVNVAEDDQVDLMKIPGQRHDVAPISLQASLQEAKEILDQQKGEALYVWRTTAPGINRIYGILTREKVHAGYQ
jgi:CIC family chloride channel protein